MRFSTFEKMLNHSFFEPHLKHDHLILQGGPAVLVFRVVLENAKLYCSQRRYR